MEDAPRRGGNKLMMREKTESGGDLISAPDDDDNDSEFDLNSAVDLFQPALGFLVQVDWHKIPRMLAVALAAQRVLLKEKKQVHAMALDILRQARLGKAES